MVLRSRIQTGRSPAGILALGILALGLSACGSDDSTGPKDPTELEFAPELGVDLSQMTKTASGLYWQDLVVGSGAEAEATSMVTVHYTGWLHNGTKFDSSYDRGEPAIFPLANLILGWREGIPGMRVGGKRKLVVPSQLGYGPSGQGSIPGNATLVFDIELLGVQ
jgi:FKBP-type peptidyl-prolyl cis-trans isomerase